MKVNRFFAVLTIFVLFSSTYAFADEPFSSYTYDYWGAPIPAPAAYIPARIVDGSSLGINDFKSPADLFTAPDHKIYIADSGNNRIVVVNENWELDRIIDKFDRNSTKDTFKNPQGLFITNEGDIYVADTDNSRIIHLNAKGDFVREIGPPEADIIPADFKYRPTALAVDKAKRIFVVAQGVNQGLVELDSQGQFRGYMGASKVIPNMVDYFWKVISTDEQRQRLELFVPTEYNNVSIDKEGFIYVTTSSIAIGDIDYAINTRSEDEKYAPVRKLNPTGDDVLRRKGYFPPVGDVFFRSRGYAESGNSMLADVCIDETGIYSVLDIRKGRIFTYDSDSNLLFVFGSIGNRLGNFRSPVALDEVNGNFVVLDSNMCQITVFESTDYGRLVREAVSLHLKGKYDESAARWEEVLKFNANSELAYIGMGKAFLRKDDYKSAIKYFRLGNKRDYYSKAFDLYRQELIGDHFGLIVVLILAAVIGLRLLSRRKARRKVEA